jgi:hypothetical protein
MMANNIDDARRELRLRMGHAFGHSYNGPGQPLNHDHLNIDGFMRELERYIDARIEHGLRSRGRDR